MGFSSELHIEMHNEAMRNDEAYAADYRRHMEEEYFFSLPSDDEFETATDWRLDFTGYMEFICFLCGEPNTIDEIHSECHYREKFWSEQVDDDLPF